MLSLPRRTFLRGAGAALSLPFLEAMRPRTAWANSVAAAPKRLGYFFFPNGAIMQHWTPAEAGAQYTLPQSLSPLAPHQSDLLVISGLAHDKARANGDGAGDHARSCAAFLTGSQPRKTAGADIHAGPSVDQLAANQIGHLTRLPSLEIGIEEGRQAGNCDSGYSCAYSSNISWKSAELPMAKEINPKAVFERLFGSGVDDARASAERDFYRQSILDFVADDAARLRDRLGSTDRRKVDEYFNSVREIEQRIARAEHQTRAALPEMSPPEGIPDALTDHLRLMFDLLAIAYQTDSTRIATYMLANEGSNRTYREIGVKEGHHELSHHQDDADKMAKLQQIDQYLVTQFAYFLDRLKSIPEGDGTLLDNCLLVYGCAIGDGNAHNHDNLPIIVAGRGGGTVNTGRHLKLDAETPMNNLHLSLLDRVGATVETFGDATGRLEALST
ncbi:MAG: DUF1552 domain-containing protein [Planctomycetaceae bacterium]|nr:DUF1552 domain-containing protein [Planctomycetaceae bacterium]